VKKIPRKLWYVLLVVVVISGMLLVTPGLLYASPKWTVTFNSMGGSPVAPKSNIPNNTTITLPTPPTWSDHSFIGWNTANYGSGTVFDGTTKVTANITVYAQWTYTVTFDPNGGSHTTAPISGILYNQTITLPTPPTQPGYTFSEWNTAEDGSGCAFDETTAVTGNITVYAQWGKKAVHRTEPVWVRTMPMTCLRVWINEDNKFQFSFIWPYRDNNWVRIYDMAGNMVYEIDMPYDNPNIIVDLPDGMYTVKTFNDQPTPIQEFVIGKP
jgi:uncharacterized repeat protein (TIGR02543 family)